VVHVELYIQRYVAAREQLFELCILMQLSLLRPNYGADLTLSTIPGILFDRCNETMLHLALTLWLVTRLFPSGSGLLPFLIVCRFDRWENYCMHTLPVILILDMPWVNCRNSVPELICAIKMPSNVSTIIFIK
jgi:hypothetical protein